MSSNGQSAAGPEVTPHTPAAGTGTLRRAVVVGGNRIPFARTGGAYTKSSNQDMLTAA
ncbi:acetyl-Coa acetyltransferase [Arthrobacter sp. Hiyo6]|nr:acetyl-Coa acetyltransferase [Arthrobacter sp. Hiyo6]